MYRAFNKRLIVVCLATHFFSQLCGQGYFGAGPVKWENNNSYKISPEAGKYDQYDVVILSEVTEFHFYANNNEKVLRNVKYKINTAEGLKILKDFKTPESFDPACDEALFCQGRRSRIKTPFIQEYKLTTFAARKFSAGRWSNVRVSDKYERIRWINGNGEFVDEDLTIMHLGGLAVGDVLEIYYEASFSVNYGTNLFYFHSRWPKLDCEYSFITKIDKQLKDLSFIFPVNVAEWDIKETSADYGDYLLQTKRIKVGNLEALDYPVNTFPAMRLPHVKADFNFYRNFITSPSGRRLAVVYNKSKNFEWLISTDTTVLAYEKIYDKQFGAIRKFLATLPPTGSDSQNVVFFSALCDSFNAFRFITANHMFYNESHLLNVYSGDHLLKRRLPENMLGKLYANILYDKQVFFYLVNVMDNRLGEHSLNYRAHQGYEKTLIALPLGQSVFYFMPRAAGLKYHLNELPFYHEGSLAALTPANFQPNTPDKESKVFRIIKTHKGTYNENTRTENASVKLGSEKKEAVVIIKESLSGQFSTVLRHLYLNEIIDSTISPHYFRKCTDKPGASEIKIKPGAFMRDYPFRYNFNCSEKLKLESPTLIPLKRWFSFPIGKKQFPRLPQTDYYFDFEFSDLYNFLIEPDANYIIRNQSSFSKNISNDYFELASSIKENGPGVFLLSVKLVVKQRRIPAENMALLSDLLDALDEVDNFSLELGK